jgi:hypothetical protein
MSAQRRLRPADSKDFLCRNLRHDRAILLGSGYRDDDGGFARADLVPSALMGRPNQNVLWSQRRRRNAEVSGRFGIESSRFLRREQDNEEASFMWGSDQWSALGLKAPAQT